MFICSSMKQNGTASISVTTISILMMRIIGNMGVIYTIQVIYGQTIQKSTFGKRLTSAPQISEGIFILGFHLLNILNLVNQVKTNHQAKSNCPLGYLISILILFLDTILNQVQPCKQQPEASGPRQYQQDQSQLIN